MVEKGGIPAAEGSVAGEHSGADIAARSSSAHVGTSSGDDPKLLVMDDLGARPGIGAAELEAIETYFGDLIDEVLGSNV